MTHERWRQIESLYQAARSLAPEDRAVFLSGISDGLRGEVTALLARDEATSASMQTVTQTVAAPIGPGTLLGPYRIEVPLGQGGMGQVFSAIDTRLGRKVAIKVSHEHFSQRFGREAKAISSLNHPHICTLYDVGPNYLVMERVDGETLAARLKKGKLALPQIMQFGEQIADALAAAHAQGITHSDLKPGNIMLSKSGVKVLDFGLAKSQDDDTLTGANAVVGTPAYMAPEQKEGKEADARADIYALGLVLFEMTTARRRDGHETAPCPENSQFAHVVERCLADDPAERWQSAGDVCRELRWASQAASLSPAARPHGLSAGIAGVLLAGILVLAAALGWIYFQSKPAAPVVRSTLTLPGESIAIHSFAISPDGHYVAIAAQMNGRRQIWLRALDTVELQPLPGTEEGIYPFWSPDSRFIGFFSDGKLRKIAAGGGPAQAICDAPFGRGGSWNRNGVIIFSPSAGVKYQLQRVAASGGAPVNITNAGGGGIKHPLFLPDGRHFLFTAGASTAERSGIFAGSLDSTASRRILPDISGMAFAAGMLLFVRENNLVAQPLDTASGPPMGGLIPVAAGVAKTSNLDYAPVTASDTGLLLYQTGGNYRGNQFLWVDRTGKTLEAVGSPGRMNNPALSHDEKRLLFTSTMAGPIDTWVRDLARGTEQRLITSPPFENAMARWSPGGDSVVFGSDRLGVMNLFLKNLSDGQEQPLVVNNSYKATTQWSRDGRFIVYTQVDSQTNRDIWVIPMEGSKPGQPVAFLHTNANEFLGQLSPDSKWMAYTSDESGRREVYVRAFPSGQNLTSISLAGGEAPRWSADGRELFFVAADGRMNAVPVKSAGSTFEPGTPVPLFNANLVRSPNEPLIDYDVSSDGKRFLITTAAQGPTSATLNLISNWTAALNR